MIFFMLQGSILAYKCSKLSLKQKKQSKVSLHSRKQKKQTRVLKILHTLCRNTQVRKKTMQEISLFTK